MAGLQAGDLITKVDNESVLTIQLFSEKLYQKSDGETMRLTVNRKDKEGYSQLSFDVNVKLIQNI
jgi:S1-C subfamily serine protease